MSDKNDLKIKAGVEGADEIGRAADKALTPWESRAKVAGKALKAAFQDAATDIVRVVTLGNAISFQRAMEEANKYRQEIGRLSANNGPVGALRDQVDGLSKSKLIGEQEIVSSIRGLQHMSGRAGEAMVALGALKDEADATGETLTEKLPLVNALMSHMGVSTGDVASELGRVRAIADTLNMPLKDAEDRITGIADVLGTVGTKADADRAKLEALALVLGKGQSAEVGKRSAATIIADMSHNRRDWERKAGMPLGALTNDDGTLNISKTIDAKEQVQRMMLKAAHGDKKTAMFLYKNHFGGSWETASAEVNTDWNEVRRAAGAKPSGKTADEAEAFRKSKAAEAERRRLAIERESRKSAEEVQPVADKFDVFLAKHPILGGLGLGAGGRLGIKVAGWGLDKLGAKALGAFTGKAGGAVARAALTDAEKYAAVYGAKGLGIRGIGAVASRLALPLQAITLAGDHGPGAPIAPELDQYYKRRTANPPTNDKERQEREEEYKRIVAGVANKPADMGGAGVLAPRPDFDMSTLPNDIKQGIGEGITKLVPALREAFTAAITISNDTDHPLHVNKGQKSKGIRQ